MTNREFLTMVSNGTINEEVKTHAVEQLKKMDERNSKRSSKPTKAQKENEPIKAAILEKLPADGMVASEIAELVDITTAKASSLCGQLVKDGLLRMEDVKIPKKGKCKKYFPVSVDTEDTNIEETE